MGHGYNIIQFTSMQLRTLLKFAREIVCLNPVRRLRIWLTTATSTFDFRTVYNWDIIIKTLEAPRESDYGLNDGDFGLKTRTYHIYCGYRECWPWLVPMKRWVRSWYMIWIFVSCLEWQCWVQKRMTYTIATWPGPVTSGFKFSTIRREVESESCGRSCIQLRSRRLIGLIS